MNTRQKRMQRRQIKNQIIKLLTAAGLLLALYLLMVGILLANT